MIQNAKLVNDTLWNAFIVAFNNKEDIAWDLLRGCIETRHNQLYWEVIQKVMQNERTN